MASIKITASDGGDLERLAKDLVRATERITPETRQVVQRGALNIKKGWQASWAGHPTYKMLPAAITYETRTLGMAIVGEIGPDKARPQGALGNIIEVGTSKNAPNPGGGPALRDEAPRFERALADAAEKAIEL